MNRRSLFRSIGSAGAAIVVATPAVAALAPAPVVVPLDPVIEAYNRTFVIIDRYKNEKYGSPMIEPLNSEVDVLFKWLMQTFYGSPTRKQIEEVFKNSRNPLLITLEYFQSVDPQAIPVLSAKLILGSYKLQVEPINMKEWKTFVQRYAHTLPSF